MRRLPNGWSAACLRSHEPGGVSSRATWNWPPRSGSGPGVPPRGGAVQARGSGQGGTHYRPVPSACPAAAWGRARRGWRETSHQVAWASHRPMSGTEARLPHRPERRGLRRGNLATGSGEKIVAGASDHRRGNARLCRGTTEKFAPLTALPTFNPIAFRGES